MQPSNDPRLSLDDQAFRDALRDVVAETGRSMRSVSLAMGRDPGYVAALLDPTRPSRARPTPDDLLALSDATRIPFIELLSRLWGIPAGRLALEVGRGDPAIGGATLADLSPEDRAAVAAFARFLASGRQQPG